MSKKKSRPSHASTATGTPSGVESRAPNRRTRRSLIGVLIACGLLATSVEFIVFSPLRATGEPPVLGGLVMYAANQKDRPNPDHPAFYYQHSGSDNLITATIVNGSKPGNVMVVFADISPSTCSVIDSPNMNAPSVPLIQSFKKFATDFAPSGEGYEFVNRELYRTVYYLRPHADISISCSLSATPEWRSFSSRELDFAMPWTAKAFADTNGWKAVDNETISLRLDTATEFDEYGGHTHWLADQPAANLSDSFLVNLHDPEVRFTWVDLRNDELEGFLQFLSGILTAFAVGAIIELIRLT